MFKCIYNYTVVDNSENSVVPVQDISHTTPVYKHAFCEGNSDEMFLPLVDKHKGVFKNVPGIIIFSYVWIT